MPMTGTLKPILTGALLVAAAFLVVRQAREFAAPADRVFFYDLSAEKLFPAPRASIPPIRGVDGREEDAMRAVVVSTNGRPAEKSSWQVAYLERFSPELKRQMEEARTTGEPPPMGRTLAQAHRFVRRVADTNWHLMGTPEAEAIVNEWMTAGPGGGPATVFNP
ncbi:MAG: hypothetical protein ACYDC1_01195 [Limisphaerales bacterium]